MTISEVLKKFGVELSYAVRSWVLAPVLSKLDAQEAEMSLLSDALIALDGKIDELQIAINAKVDQTQNVAAATQITGKVQTIIDAVNAL